jgi:hypothetical protein
MIIKRINVLKAAIINGAVTATLMFIIALLAFLFVLSGLGNGLGAMGMLGNIGIVIFAPIFYGVIGFIFGAIFAFIYNLVAGVVGGIELEVE